MIFILCTPVFQIVKSYLHLPEVEVEGEDSSRYMYVLFIYYMYSMYCSYTHSTVGELVHNNRPSLFIRCLF